MTEPILTWEDTRGYALSDRIWNVSEMTAQQIDLLLQESIAQGTASLTLSKNLEQFLLPGRELKRTNRPYGTDASFNAMRLSRSEITRSFSIATQAAAVANPFVNRVFYHLSASHVSEGGGDLCEAFADESEANGGYEPEDAPLPEVDTHPNCMCYLTQGTISEDDFLALFEDGQLPPEVEDQIGLFDNWQDFVAAILGLLPDLWDEIFN